jgi:hypothetical protein
MYHGFVTRVPTNHGLKTRDTQTNYEKNRYSSRNGNLFSRGIC